MTNIGQIMMISLADEGVKKRREDVLHLISNQDLHTDHQVSVGPFAVAAQRDLQRDLYSIHQIFGTTPVLVSSISKSRLDFLFISTVCFKSGTALAACTKKKRRRDIMDDALLEENEIRISPSMNEDMEDLEEDHNLRDPRFLTTFFES